MREFMLNVKTRPNQSEFPFSALLGATTACFAPFSGENDDLFWYLCA